MIDQPAPRRLRVLAITPTAVLSGAERVLINHARADLVDQWTIAAPDGATGARIETLGIDRLRIPELKLGSGPKPIAALALALGNLRALAPIRRAAREADVIVANSVMCLPLLRLLRPKAPVAWLVHDVITRGDLARIARWSAPAVTRSIPVSEAAGRLSVTLAIPTTVVHNGVAADGEISTLQPETPPIVGINAVLTHWKGQHVLLDALAQVDPPTVIELLGGTLPKDDPYEASLRERSQQPDLKGRVRFLGHHDTPYDVMGRWTIAVSASVEPEAGPLAVLEAMNLGLPVIVTDHGGAPEVAGDTAVTVPPGDAGALAEAITALLADPDRRDDLGNRARVRVSTRFDRGQLEERFRSVLLELAGPGPTELP
jgi:glycosyltransferase involved in cell wall biosynthesis